MRSTANRKPLVTNYKTNDSVTSILTRNEFQLVQQGALVELDNLPAHELSHVIQQGSVLKKHRIVVINKHQWAGLSGSALEGVLQNIFRIANVNSMILFFDEADAIFGKRSDIKSSHDRYANIETNYLLEKVKQYGGVVFANMSSKSGIKLKHWEKCRVRK
ncbi:MAG: ATP-binding protein [Pseudomonadales bacterium]|nr:ATP-binding protein [Pseudomonadales bacterium]